MKTISLGHRRYLHQPGPGPTVVFLHGTGGAAEWVESETGLAAYCQANGFSYAVPAGLPPRPEKPAAFLSNPQRWNDGSTTPVDPHHSTTDDVAFLDAVLADLLTRGSDPDRLFLAGFSNGAGMTFRYAAEGRVKLAGIACVAGHCWIDPPRLPRPIPTLHLVGECDPLVPVHGGRVRIPWGNRVVDRPPISWTLSKWAVANGCELSPVTSRDSQGLIVSDYFSPSQAFRSLVIPGHGHHWPGGAGQLNPRLGGPNNSPVSANEMVCEFFRTSGGV